QLGCRAQHAGLGILQNEIHQGIGSQCGPARVLHVEREHGNGLLLHLAQRPQVGSPVEESWCTIFLVGVPRSKMPSSPSSRITTQLPLMRGSSEFTAAVTKFAKA